MTDEEKFRKRLADELAAGGSLRTAPWRAAFDATPRHEFLRGGFFRQVEGAVPSAWTPVLPDDPGWSSSCYDDVSLVTQIAGTIVPADIRGQVMRLPTSSSTLPSLVVRMLEDLNVEDGMRVLEIGTGTGYSTALLSHRLGDALVTSVEYDPDVAARARAALGAVGRYPDLVTGDGLEGFARNAPYDRVIATCGVHTVPRAWIEQTRPGGQILTTVGGWLGSSELARLTVHDDGSASGPLLGGQVSFMFARPQLPPPLGMLPDLDAGDERATSVGADMLTDWSSAVHRPIGRTTGPAPHPPAGRPHRTCGARRRSRRMGHPERATRRLGGEARWPGTAVGRDRSPPRPLAGRRRSGR